MKHPFSLLVRSLLPLLVIVAVCAVRNGAAQEAHHYQNLKVLPKDVDPQVLRATMNSFARGLGVRCGFCHVISQPRQPDDFAKDDKPTKLKARVMMRMVSDLNEKYLTTLDSRAHPAIQVQCFTCHRGVPQPRSLQEMLEIAYSTGGLDSIRARYSTLRDHFYGSAAYDFGEVPLADVASAVRDSGHVADALALLDLNMQMNPSSAFAKRQYAQTSVLGAFGTQGGDSGVATYRAMKARFGPDMISQDALNAIGYQLLNTGRSPAAIAAFELNAAEHPESGDTYDSLGEAYLKSGDKKKAIANYQKAAALDSTNTHALDQLKELHAKPLKKAKK